MYVLSTRPSGRTMVLSLLLMVLVAMAGTALAERPSMPFADYRTESWYLPQSPGVTGTPVATMFNPASFSLNDGVGFDAWWDSHQNESYRDNYGFAFGKTLGFAMNSLSYGTAGDHYKIYDYQVGLSTGTRAGVLGIGYRWSNGETDRTPHHKALALGLVSRGNRWVSFGASGLLSLESSAAQYIFDLGVRPFGRDWMTVYADWTANDDQSFFTGGSWGAGLEVRPVNGLHLGFKARENLNGDDFDYSVMLGVTLRRTNFAVMPFYHNDGPSTASTYLVRGTVPFKGLKSDELSIIPKKPSFLAISLENKLLNYQKFQYFDDTNVAWMDLLPILNGARDDKSISGVAINIAGMRGRPSLLWEMRVKLQEIQSAGKKVYIHADRLSAMTYYLASVADHISLDPMGSIDLHGIAMRRTYMKGTLDKLGIGLQPLRFFKYKSAVESFSRDSMSEGDREQRQRLADVIYENWNADTSSGRNLADNAYNNIVDDKASVLAREALELGLVDEIGRWNVMNKLISNEHGAKLSGQLPEHLGHEYYDEQWGAPRKIAVVFAVGECAMDSGIRGRATSAYMRKLAKDPAVAAVVLRADSPGGDPLPSDLIAEATRILKAAGKPVIVSQGDVAASGGYWISMDGTEILTTPMTITGSIGVISAWGYDNGIAEKMGITSQSVGRGKHADLFSPINLPFLGGIPARPLDEDEFARHKEVIIEMYEGFINSVAEGRNMDPKDVSDVAQGRVWMGEDAIEHGLCDRLGTLDDAIELARDKAGIPDWQDVQLTEYPPRPMFKFPSFGPALPSLLGLGTRINELFAAMLPAPGLGQTSLGETALPLSAPGLDSFDIQYLKTMVESKGQPVMMVEPENVPADWRLLD
jgi:protease IV